MRIIFFGTPDYVLSILEGVHKRFSRRRVSPIAAVVTQPPRPSGRKQMLEFSPVDSWAFKKKLPIFHGSRELLDSGITADLGILAAYGEIIPEEVLKLFPFGIINVHPSLLPKWRGASPVQAPIIAGEEITGVSIIKLDAKLDHGPIISQFKESILEKDTTGTLRARLFERSAQVLVELLEAYLKSKIIPREQNHKQATFATQIKKEDGFIPSQYLEAALQGSSFKGDWEIEFIKDFVVEPTPAAVDRFVKAMDPWPVAWTYIQLGKRGHKRDKKRLKILKAHLEESKLVLDQVQLEGKGAVSWKQFNEAYADATLAEE